MRSRIALLAKRYGLALGVVFFGLAYSILIAPFGVPDEPAHFWRACQISEGHIFARVGPSGESGDMLPRNVDEMVETLAHYRSVSIPATRIDRKGWARAWRMGFHSEDRAFRSFPVTLRNSPLPYLPAAAALALGREFHLSILATFYLARFTNVLAAAALVSLAWRRLPFARESFALVVLLPMTLSQIGSLSSDAVSFALAFWWIALVLSHTHGSEESSPTPRRHYFELVAAAALLGQTKFVLPLALLALLCFFSSAKSWRRTGPVCLSAIALALCSAALWSPTSNSLNIATRLDVAANPALQTAFIRQHPAEFISTLARTLRTSFFQHGREIVGVLGWLQTRLPDWLYAGTWIALAFSTGFQNSNQREKLTMAARIFTGLLALTILLSVYVVLYRTWNPVGASMIQGVQGRYLIPMLPLLGLSAMHPLWTRLGIDRPMRTALWTWALLANCCALCLQFQRAFS